MDHFPVSIACADDERIAIFHTLKGNLLGQGASNIIIVEAEKPVERLLRSSISINTLFMEENYYQLFAPLMSQRGLWRSADCFTAKRQLMEKIVGFRLHHGVMALADKPQAVPPHHLDAPIVVLNGLADPENVGSIVRNCAAFGIKSVLVDGATSDPYLRRAIRVSMGAVLGLNVSYVTDLPTTLIELKNKSRIVAIETGCRSRTIVGYSFLPNTTLVFGSERYGIEPAVLEVCDEILSVPMELGIIESLNVNATSAIALNQYYQSGKSFYK